VAEMYDDYGVVLYTIQKNGTNLFKRLFEYVLGNPSNTENEKIDYKHHILIVRNPYDRLISQWMHVTQIKSIYWDKKEQNTLVRYCRKQRKEFKNWVIETYKTGYTGDDNHILSQSECLHIIPDKTFKIFKLEDLIVDDLFYFLPEIDSVNLNDKYKEILESLNGSIDHHSRQYRALDYFMDYYDDEVLEICNSYFNIDFKNFGYEIVNHYEISNLNPIKFI
jgi:hypothetical protein